MFVLKCQKKFQVVQSVTALFVLRGRGRARVRPSLQVGGRTRGDALWRATSSGQQGKRSSEPVSVARPGCGRRGEQPEGPGRRGKQAEGSERRAGRGAAEGSGSPSGPRQRSEHAAGRSHQAPATLRPATRPARAFEAEPAQLHAERKGRADTLE